MKFLSLLFLGFTLYAKDAFFFEKPYLQLGDRPKLSSKGLDLMWIGHDRDIAWTVEYKTSKKWIGATPSMLRRVDVTGTAAHRVYSAPLAKLKPGKPFTYRISSAGKIVFEASAIARKPKKAASHFVVFGDCAANTIGQREVAYQVAQQKPDYIFITGDIVYSRGRVSEYQTNFWPVYSADQADPKVGAPLLSGTLFTGVIGNHDSQPLIDFDTNPDALAFYHYWSLPLNGPTLTPGAKNTPELKGNETIKKNFLAATSNTFPRMANYSFDYGTVHWTVIDSNVYVDWSSPEFREWLREDLKAASKAKWRIVGFHHPPFNSSKAHFKEQRIRMLAEIFEAGKVDLVMSGHVHNYQRTHPLTFQVEPGFVLGKNTEVPGKWTLDKSFDGDKNTKPNGVLYIITGAGGANLYNREQNGDPSSWLDFTNKFVSDVHSFTVIDAETKQLQIRQISAAGKELDHFTITR